MKKVQVALFAAALLVIAGASSAQAETVVDEHKPLLVESSAVSPVAPEAPAQPVGAVATEVEVAAPVDTTTETAPDAAATADATADTAGDHDAGAQAEHVDDSTEHVVPVE